MIKPKYELGQIVYLLQGYIDENFNEQPRVLGRVRIGAIITENWFTTIEDELTYQAQMVDNEGKVAYGLLDDLEERDLFLTWDEAFAEGCKRMEKEKK